MSNREGFETSQSVTDTVRGIHRILQISDFFTRKTLRAFGLSGPQVWALRAIRDGECTSLKDLAQRTHLTLSTVSSIVDFLEERGYAARRRTPGEERTVDLRLKAAGRKVLSLSPEPPRSKIVRGLERLSTENLSCVRRAVEILSRILDLPELPNQDGQAR